MYLKNKDFSLFSFIVFNYLFFLYFFSEQIRIITISIIILFLIYYILLKKILISSYKDFFIFGIYIIISFFPSVFYGNSKLEDIVEFIVMIFLGMLISMPYQNYNLRKKQIMVLKNMGVIVIIGCMIQIIFPNFLIQINRIRMSPMKFKWFYDFFNSNFIVGFSFQTAVTGFYLALMICISFSYFMYTNKNFNKIIIGISLIINYIFLFLTGKRIFIGLTFLIIIFLYVLKNKDKLYKIFVILIFNIFFMYFLFENTQIGKILIRRMKSEDFTRGRIYIYSQLFENYKKHIILGNGLSSTINQFKEFSNGHNIYLQLLNETGVIGFFIIVVYFIYNLISAFKLYRYKIKYNEDEIQVIIVCISIQLLFLGWGFTGNPLYDVYPFIVYTISVGIINSIQYEIKKERNGKNSFNYNTCI